MRSRAAASAAFAGVLGALGLGACEGQEVRAGRPGAGAGQLRLRGRGRGGAGPAEGREHPAVFTGQRGGGRPRLRHRRRAGPGGGGLAELQRGPGFVGRPRVRSRRGWRRRLPVARGLRRPQRRRHRRGQGHLRPAGRGLLRGARDRVVHGQPEPGGRAAPRRRRRRGARRLARTGPRREPAGVRSVLADLHRLRVHAGRGRGLLGDDLGAELRHRPARDHEPAARRHGVDGADRGVPAVRAGRRDGGCPPRPARRRADGGSRRPRAPRPTSSATARCSTR